MMGDTTPRATTFVSRGRLSGVIRERLPRRGSNGARRPVLEAHAARQAPDQQSVDEALYYRARLILGDSLPRPLL
jgi:hypothetical protein